MALISYILILFLFIQTSFAQGDKWSNDVVDLKGMRVLVFTNPGSGYVHENIPYSIAAIQNLGKEHGFTVDTTTNVENFNDAYLKKYNALIFSNASSLALEKDSQKLALMRYVQAGGGFVGIHIATGEKKWKWYKQMIGGAFLMHPEFQEFNVLAVDKKHPSVAVVPEIWTVEDECYFFKDWNPTVRVLMVSDTRKLREKTELPDAFGDLIPTVWCNDFDGGRQWYTALGHSVETYSDPIFLGHVLGGLKWAAAKNLNYGKAYATGSNQ